MQHPKESAPKVGRKPQKSYSLAVTALRRTTERVIFSPLPSIFPPACLGSLLVVFWRRCSAHGAKTALLHPLLADVLEILPGWYVFPYISGVDIQALQQGLNRSRW